MTAEEHAAAVAESLNNLMSGKAFVVVGDSSDKDQQPTVYQFESAGAEGPLVAVKVNHGGGRGMLNTSPESNTLILSPGNITIRVLG